MWGNVLIPTSGTVTVKITGDILQATVKSGLETKDSWTRIQNVDSVEIAEAPLYIAIGIGAVLCLAGLGSFAGGSFDGSVMGFILLACGITCIVYAFMNKRRLLAIHSFRNTIPVFMTKPSEGYQQFGANVMAIARQLNAPPAGAANNGRPATAQANRPGAAAQKTNAQ
jgi:hypothetical protein